MTRLNVEEARINGGDTVSAVVDLRSARLKAVILPSGWNAANVSFRVGATADVVLKLVNFAGTEEKLVGTAGQVILVAPNDLECLGYTKIGSGLIGAPVAQGTAATFTTTPTTFDFSVGDPVTFTIAVTDSENGTTSADVTLDADYTNIAGLVAELATQAPAVTWAAVVGDLKASFIGPDAELDVTNVVDALDELGLTAGGITFPRTATDKIVTLLTEPRI